MKLLKLVSKRRIAKNRSIEFKRDMFISTDVFETQIDQDMKELATEK